MIKKFLTQTVLYSLAAVLVNTEAFSTDYGFLPNGRSRSQAIFVSSNENSPADKKDAAAHARKRQALAPVVNGVERGLFTTTDNTDAAAPNGNNIPLRFNDSSREDTVPHILSLVAAAQQPVVQMLQQKPAANTTRKLVQTDLFGNPVPWTREWIHCKTGSQQLDIGRNIMVTVMQSRFPETAGRYIIHLRKPFHEKTLYQTFDTQREARLYVENNINLILNMI